jgi:hypothetical protein
MLGAKSEMSRKTRLKRMLGEVKQNEDREAEEEEIEEDSDM